MEKSIAEVKKEADDGDPGSFGGAEMSI